MNKTNYFIFIQAPLYEKKIPANTHARSPSKCAIVHARAHLFCVKYYKLSPAFIFF